MTAIVGYLDKKTKTVIIGGDSAGVAGLNVTIRKDPKVFKNGEFIFGCTSSFRMIQLLRYSLFPPEIKTKDIYQYMCTEFIDEVRRCFKDGGYLQQYTDGADKGGTFLVAYKDRIFTIDNDFQVAENINNIHAIGCGSDFALGAIYTLEKEDLPPLTKVTKALEAAVFFSGGVRKPFVFCSTLPEKNNDGL